jgi:hypothetical protein
MHKLDQTVVPHRKGASGGTLGVLRDKILENSREKGGIERGDVRELGLLEAQK